MCGGSTMARPPKTRLIMSRAVHLYWQNVEPFVSEWSPTDPSNPLRLMLDSRVIGPGTAPYSRLQCAYPGRLL